MNRNLVLSGCTFAIIAVVVWSGCSKYSVAQSIIISEPLERVALQFTQVQNWHHWHPVVKQQAASVTYNNIDKKKKQISLPNGDSYEIKIINPAAIIIKKREANKIRISSLSASSYLDGNHTLVTYQQSITGFEKMGRFFSHNHQDESDLLEHLKAFSEDENRSYGFSIQTIPVFDTLILTTSIKTVPDSILKITSALYAKLAAYCKQNALLLKNYYYTSAVALSNEEVQVSVGVPVQKQSGKAGADFAFLQLPPSGRLVMGRYEGRYKNKQQLYTAVNEYIQDKHMKKVAQALEQYPVDNAPYHDTDVVHMQLYYPVF